MTCKSCGAEMVQKSRARLVTVGLVMMASLAIAFPVPWFWTPGAILFLVGIYLLLWGTLGRGAWCRNCKKFSLHV
jgi:hypothetical protein